MTPEKLWSLGRVSALGLSNDGQKLLYNVSTPSVEANKSLSKKYTISIAGGMPVELSSVDNLLKDKSISPDGRYQITAEEVKINKVLGKEFYTDMDKSNVRIYDGLNYRHWDTWEDGSFSHLFVRPIVNGKAGEGEDIMAKEAFDCPQKPFGGDEDFTWSPDSKKIIYVTKRKTGTEYAVSTNTDLFEYDITTRVTTNLTPTGMGYDTEPAFSKTGALAWMSMKRDGYESDKNDIMVRTGTVISNLTAQWDGTVTSFRWNNDGKKIYFNAPVGGTLQ